MEIRGLTAPTSNDLAPQFEPLEPRLLLSGTLYEVNTLADSLTLNGNDNQLTLREAIYAANTNTSLGNIPAGSALDVDAIIFNQAALQTQAGAGQPLTITLAGAQLPITDSLSIQGFSNELLTLNANQNSRVFSITGTNINVELYDLDITGGSSPTDGGGIYLDTTGTLAIDNLYIYNNGAYINGGGIFSSPTSTLFISNSWVVGNGAFGPNGEGGAVSNLGDQNNPGVAVIINTIISGNFATNFGGGIITTGDLTIQNSHISGNFANTGGGVSHLGLINPLNIINSEIVGNVAETQGGGVYAYSEPMSIYNSTITHNTAGQAGGGVYAHLGNSFLNNSIASLNFAPQYPDINLGLTLNASRNGIDPYFVRNPSPGPDNIWATNDDDYGDLRLTYIPDIFVRFATIDVGDNNLTPPDIFDLDDDNNSTEPIPFDFNGNPRIVNNYVDIGAHEYQIIPVSDDHSNEPANATPISIDSSNPGEIEYGDDIDYFSFQATQNTTYTLQTNLLTLQDTTLTLYDQDGITEITTNDDSPTGYNSLIQWTANQDGQYFLKVTGYDNTTLGTYTLNITESAPPEDDHSNTPANATPVAINSTTQGALESLGDTDWFTFPATQNATYTFETNLLTLPDTILTLYFFDGTTQLLTDADSGLGYASKIQWTCNVAGPHYLKVSSYNNSYTGTYTLDVTGPPPVPGDINSDGIVDATDIQQLTTAINTNNQNPFFDLNTDGAVNPQDGLHLITNILNTFPADFNLDYQVDVADLSTWATGFGKTTATGGSNQSLYAQGDSNFDGQIDVADLSLWATNFGKTSTPPAPISTPLTQSSYAVADTYILDTTPPTNPFTPNQSARFFTPGSWANIKNLLNPTSTLNQKLDIIKNIHPL